MYWTKTYLRHLNEKTQRIMEGFQKNSSYWLKGHTVRVNETIAGLLIGQRLFIDNEIHVVMGKKTERDKRHTWLWYYDVWLD